MFHVDNEVLIAAETDGPAALSEPENAVRVSTVSSDLPTHSSRRGSISITAESKNNPRCIIPDASTPNASGESKGVQSSGQPGKNGGHHKSKEENFQDPIQVQSVSAPTSQVPVEIAAAVTIGYWLALWYWITPWKVSIEWRKETQKYENVKEILNIISMSKVNAERILRSMDINNPMALVLVMEEEWMKSCPCTQKERYWKSVYAFQQEYAKLKEPESF